MLRWRESADAFPSPTAPAVRPCTAPDSPDRRVFRRFPALLPCWPRTRHPLPAESPSTRSCDSSCRFFQRPPHRFMTDGSRRSPTPPPCGPAAAASSWRNPSGASPAAWRSFRLLLAVQHLLVGGVFTRLAMTGCSKPSVTNRSTQLLHRPRAAAKRLGDLRVGPGRTRRHRPSAASAPAAPF